MSSQLRHKRDHSLPHDVVCVLVSCDRTDSSVRSTRINPTCKRPHGGAEIDLRPLAELAVAAVGLITRDHVIADLIFSHTGT